VADTLPILNANARKQYFLNPIPDSFYTGNTDISGSAVYVNGDHLRGDYYAFEWGDALFVAIEPYWYSQKKPYAGSPGGDLSTGPVGTRWDWTLGQQQYEWLRQTLANSTATYKFVFAHHVAGGIEDYGRGGALATKYCEWGGYDPDGTTYTFDTNRPGWEMPVHQVFVQNHVTAFFHAHDHAYAKETQDGVVYQLVPMAANPNYDKGFDSNPIEYADTTLIANSGHLRVTVSSDKATVAYVRSFLPGDGVNGTIAATYDLLGPSGPDAGAGGAGGSAGSAGTAASGAGGVDGGAAGASGDAGQGGGAGAGGGAGQDNGTGGDGGPGGGGASGSSGDAGSGGGAVATGEAGASGGSGEAGASGGSGEAGASGGSGEAGASGGSGEAGASGASGQAGTTGVAGAGGAAGAGGTGGAGGPVAEGGAGGLPGSAGAGGISGAGGAGGVPGTAGGGAGGGSAGASGATGGAAGAPGVAGAAGTGPAAGGAAGTHAGGHSGAGGAAGHGTAGAGGTAHGGGDNGGCGCETAPSPTRGSGLLLVMGALLLFARRRHRPRA
jgi:hypothetical protein